MSKYWTEEERDFVIANYENLGAIGCSLQLSRSPTAIRNYVYKQKLPVTASGIKNKSKISSAIEKHREKAESLGFQTEEYKGSQVKIVHTHSCGYKWLVSPNNFHKAKGCPRCNGHVDNNITYVYYCYFPELNLYKIGITNSWEARQREFGESVELIELWAMVDRSNALSLERYLLSVHKDTLENTGLLKSGNTETFYGN